MKKIGKCEMSKMFKTMKNIYQKAINIQWVITEKIKEGKIVCKARLMARGFEEEVKEMETDAHITIKILIAKIMEEKWLMKLLDVKVAYL